MALLMAAMVFGGVNLALFSLLTWRRVTLSIQDRHRDRARARLRPCALELLSGDDDPPNVPRPADQDLLAEMLDGYARVLSGAAHARIARYFDRQGMIDRDLLTLARARKAPRRAAAAYRLGDVGPARVAPALAKALRDPDRDVRVAAARGLGRLSQPGTAANVFAALAEGQVPQLLARWALLRMGPAIVPALRDLTTVARATIRATATELLGLVGGASDVTALEASLTDPEPAVREQAATALGRLGNAGSVPELIAALADDAPPVRAAAASTLGRLHDRRSAAALTAHARSDDFEVSLAAAHALAAVDPPAVRSMPHGSFAEAADAAALR